MQRDGKGSRFNTPLAKRLDAHSDGQSFSTMLLPPRQYAGLDKTRADQQKQHKLCCQWCRGLLKVGLDTVAQKYNCWRCNYPVCSNCRVAWPRSVNMWLCNSCVKPASLTRLFERTSYGITVLVRIMEYCEPRAARIMRLLFPDLSSQHMGQRETVAKQLGRTDVMPRRRQLPAKNANERVHAEDMGGIRRRELVVVPPPSLRLMRTKTAIKHYSPMRSGISTAFRTTARSFSPQKGAESSSRLWKDKLVSGSKKPNAVNSVREVLHRDPHEAHEIYPKLIDDAHTNKFLRSGPSKGGLLASDVQRGSDAQVSTASSQFSVSRSDSPPPRFPPYAQFLEEIGSAQHLNLQNREQLCKTDRQSPVDWNGDAAAAGGAEAKCVDVVELGIRPESHDTIRETLPSSATAHAAGSKMPTVSPEPVINRHFGNPPPNLRTTIKSSNSQRMLSTYSGSRANAVTSRTTTNSIYGISITSCHRNNDSISQSSFKMRPGKVIVNGDNNRGTRPSTTQGATARLRIATARTTPRPLGTRLASPSTDAKAYATSRRGFGVCDTRKVASGLTGEDMVRRKNLGATSPRFTRKPTTQTSLTDKNPSSSFGVPLVSRTGNKKVESFLTARPVPSKRTKPLGATTTPTGTPTPLRRMNTTLGVQNTTPRASGTRTPFQRIASSRLMPSGENTRRYVPLQVNEGHAKKLQIRAPPSPFTLIHIPRTSR